jgi:hypothetical protein
MVLRLFFAFFSFIGFQSISNPWESDISQERQEWRFPPAFSLWRCEALGPVIAMQK